MTDSDSDNNEQLYGILAIISLVLGILSITCCCFTICQLPLPIAGLVCGFFGLKSQSKSQFAKVGLALNAVGLVLSIGYFIASLAFQLNNPSFMQQLQQKLQHGSGANP